MILLNLGIQPLVNNLCRSKEAALHAKQYQLCATIDDDLLIKLDTTVPSDELYKDYLCLLYTSPSPRDRTRSRMPSSA